MIADIRQGHILDCLFHYASDVGLHRDVFEGGLYPELAMDLLRQIDMDLAPPDRRFHKSPHDSQYFCTERYWNSSRFTQFFARSFCAERVTTEAENPTFAGFSHLDAFRRPV
jgi:hypothetical protein